MYNGIGLLTPRGSGTNGYVQRNLSHIQSKPQRVEYFRPDQAHHPSQFQKKPDKDIIEHQRKRQIELQVLQWVEETQLHDKGYTEGEVAAMVDKKRAELLSHSKQLDIEDPKNLQETHARNFAKEQENEKLARAFGIKDFVPGSAFDRKLQQERKEERLEQRKQREFDRREEERRKRKERGARDDERHSSTHTKDKDNNRDGRDNKGSTETRTSTSSQESHRHKESRSKEVNNQEKPDAEHERRGDAEVRRHSTDERIANRDGDGKSVKAKETDKVNHAQREVDNHGNPHNKRARSSSPSSSSASSESESGSDSDSSSGSDRKRKRRYK